MHISHIDSARRAQAAFANKTGGVQPQQQHARLSRFGPRNPATLRTRNLLQLLTVAQLLGHSLRSLPGPVNPPALRPAPTHGVPGGVQALPGGEIYQMLIEPPAADPPPSLSSSFQALSNGAAGVCITRPHDCVKTIALTGIATASVAASSAFAGFSLGRWSAASSAASPANEVPSVPRADEGLVPLRADDAPLSPQRADVLMHLLPPQAQTDVLEIVRACNGDADCATPQIHDVLARLPVPQQRALQCLMYPHGAPAASATTGSWPPVAEAQALDWMAQAAALLAALDHGEQLQLQLDVESISQATLDAKRDAANSHVRRRPFDPAYERRINQARMQAIKSRFEHEGWQMQEQGFTVNATTDMGEHGLHSGQNLWLEFVGEGPTQRTLMLMAHGDVAGIASRSSGAWENGSGVAALLALARRIGDTGLPPGTRVQLLVTDLEQHGMIGAKAFVQQCQAEGRCPDLAVNLDRLGWGNTLALSGTDRHPLITDALEHAGQREARAVTALEASFAEQLQQSAARYGLRIADAPQWALASDHIALQREGVAALGVSQSTAGEMEHDVRFREARERMLEAERGVDWARYPDYNARLLEPQAQREYTQQLDRWRAARNQFGDVGMPRAQRVPNSPQDQPDAVDARAALRVVDSVHAALQAWLRAPHA